MINEIKNAIKVLKSHADEDFVSKKEALEAAISLENLLKLSKDSEVESIYEYIKDEVLRAENKHPKWPKDKLYAAAIVAEENGELMRAAVQFQMEGGSINEIRKEAIQTAATCVRLLKNI